MPEPAWSYLCLALGVAIGFPAGWAWFRWRCALVPPWPRPRIDPAEERRLKEAFARARGGPLIALPDMPVRVIRLACLQCGGPLAFADDLAWCPRCDTSPA